MYVEAYPTRRCQLLTSSGDIKFPIRLEGLASRHHMFSSYEPELFPGLIYRMIKPKIVLLIFVSGKIVLTGAKVREEIYQAFEMIYPVLQGIRYFYHNTRSSTNTDRFPQSLSYHPTVLFFNRDRSLYQHILQPKPPVHYTFHTILTA